MALYNPRGIGMRKIGSCGHPVPMTEVKIVDEDGKALPLGMEGELQVRGPQIMQGYHNNDTATKETLTDDGWLKTGDVAIVDDEGFIFIVDRIKELIKVKGMQVNLNERLNMLQQKSALLKLISANEVKSL
jgi:long-chain acyl-CoA synthetase